MGTCGRVFEQPGAISALKLSKTDDNQLWNDYIMHSRVFHGFSVLPQITKLYVPEVYYFAAASDDEWWSKREPLFPVHSRGRNVLCTERILPLPQPIRNKLIETFCPSQLKEKALADLSNNDCLARVYLGKRQENNSRAKPLPLFTLRNFNLRLDQMEGIGLRRLPEFSNRMGMALAGMHCKVGIDADDVEFVLGSSPTYSDGLRPLSPEQFSGLGPNSSTWKQVNARPNFLKRQTRLWLLDFNRCKDITRDSNGVDMAVRAFYRNDPYFPRPLGTGTTECELWDAFVEGYLAI